MAEVDVVVVGAGLAGLTVARELQRAGRSVCVLEARDRVGGRTLQHTFRDGIGVELGGQWVGPTQDRVLALVEELGLDTFPTFDDGEQVVLLKGDRKRYTGDPPLPLPSLVEVGMTQKRLERLARAVPLDAPWDAVRAVELDGQTVESWLRRSLRTSTAREFWRLVTQAVLSADASDVSLLHFCFYLHSGGMLDRLISVRHGAQQDRVVGGTQQLSERLAAIVGSVVTSAPVRRITQDDRGVTVHHDAGEVQGTRVVVTVPPTLAGRIDYVPALPAARDQLTQKMPMGAVVKCMALYDEPFWRRDGLSGQAASFELPVGVTFDNSPPDANFGVLLGFIEARHGRDASAMSAEGRRRLVLDSFQQYFGPKAADAIDYVDLDWSAEPYSRGCYGAHLAPGVWTQYGHALRRPVGRIHWAGTETADVWNGYMDGAIRSGERAAEEVLAALA